MEAVGFGSGTWGLTGVLDILGCQRVQDHGRPCRTMPCRHGMVLTMKLFQAEQASTTPRRFDISIGGQRSRIGFPSTGGQVGGIVCCDIPHGCFVSDSSEGQEYQNGKFLNDDFPGVLPSWAHVVSVADTPRPARMHAEMLVLG